MKINIEFIELYDSEGFDCECCGHCQGEGWYVLVNGTEVYRYETDGHLGGHRTEGKLSVAILAEAIACHYDTREQSPENALYKENELKYYTDILEQNTAPDDAYNECRYAALYIEQVLYEEVIVTKQIVKMY